MPRSRQARPTMSERGLDKLDQRRPEGVSTSSTSGQWVRQRRNFKAEWAAPRPGRSGVSSLRSSTSVVDRPRIKRASPRAGSERRKQKRRAAHGRDGVQAHSAEQNVTTKNRPQKGLDKLDQRWPKEVLTELDQRWRAQEIPAFAGMTKSGRTTSRGWRCRTLPPCSPCRSARSSRRGHS